MEDGIDWGRLRARLLETPIVVKPKHVKRPNRSPESLERRRVAARERSRKAYWEHREEHLAAQRAWEKANPEKVRAKRKRFYDAHKDDPDFKEKKALRNKAYKDAHKNDPEYKAKRAEYSRLYKLKHRDDAEYLSKRAEACRRYRARKKLAA